MCKLRLLLHTDHSAYDVASQDDLWQFLTEAAHEDSTLKDEVDVKMIMDTWTLQMGYPVITVNRSDDGATATVTQVKQGCTR